MERRMYIIIIGFRVLCREGKLFDWIHRTGLLTTYQELWSSSEQESELRRIQFQGTWEVRCASLLAHILPMQACEEWLGDLKEAHEKLAREGYSRWAIVLVTLGRVLLLGWSLLQIRYQDLISPKRKQRESK